MRKILTEDRLGIASLIVGLMGIVVRKWSPPLGSAMWEISLYTLGIKLAMYPHAVWWRYLAAIGLVSVSALHLYLLLF